MIMSQIKRFIDIGANLTDLMYAGVYNGSRKHEPDLPAVLKRSWESGLEKIIVTGGNWEESQKALDLANTDDRLYATVGCHPTRCLEFEENTEGPEQYLEKLKDVISRGKHKVVAIGECGLDYDRTQFCPKDIQKKYFELQLKLSEIFDLPLFLHCRNAADDLQAILRGHGSNLRGVVHSFDGTIEEARKFSELGLYIGLNGCSLKTEQNLVTVASLPSDRILLETDCPWCEIRPSHAGFRHIQKHHQVPGVKKEKWSPDSMVKSRNEPCNIRQVLDVVASVRKEEDPDGLCEKIFSNTTRLFFSPSSSSSSIKGGP